MPLCRLVVAGAVVVAAGAWAPVTSVCCGADTASATGCGAAAWVRVDAVTARSASVTGGGGGVATTGAAAVTWTVAAGAVGCGAVTATGAGCLAGVALAAGCCAAVGVEVEDGLVGAELLGAVVLLGGGVVEDW